MVTNKRYHFPKTDSVNENARLFLPNTNSVVNFLKSVTSSFCRDNENFIKTEKDKSTIFWAKKLVQLCCPTC